MDGAAANGHLHLVKWLHKNRMEACTTAAMDNAHNTNRQEDSTPAAAINATTSGDHERLLFLKAVECEGFPKPESWIKIEGDAESIDIFLWPCANYSASVDLSLTRYTFQHDELRALPTAVLETSVSVDLLARSLESARKFWDPRYFAANFDSCELEYQR